MFKSIKENEYVKKFLELWNVPRYRSLIILCIYIIFFALVIASIRGQNSNIINSPNANKVDIMEQYKKMNNYQYRVTIKNEAEQTLIGRVYENKQLIMFNENNYYYNNVYLYKAEEKIYTQTIENLLEFEVWRFSPSFINDLIEKGNFESKTEYADGIVANTYLVNVADFIKLYFGDDTDSNDNISVTIYKNDERVSKVELNLTSIYSQNQFANSYDYKVIIEYELINQIGPIVVNVESSD